MQININIKNYWLKHKKFTSLWILLFSVLVIVYVVVKASVTSFTHDESYTYLHYVHISFMKIISYNPAVLNNHILNSLLINYFELLFGNSELALRAPNIIALIIYLLFTFLLLKDLKQILTLSIFILMFSNPYLLDFFGLARGYGLSIGFMMMSLYYLIQTFQEDNQRNQILVNVGAFLSVLSNFALINYYVAALITYNIIKLLDFIVNPDNVNKKYNILRINKFHIISVVFFIAVLYEPFRKILKLDLINVGGNTGFIADTVGSLIRKTFYYTPISGTTIEILKVVVLLPVLISLLIILINILKSNKEFISNNKPLLIVNFILLLISFETIIQHHLFQNNYLMGRFALFLYPLFILNIGFLLKYFLSKRYKYITKSIAIGLTVLWLFNLSLNVSLKSYAEWRYEMETKKAFKTLLTYHEDNNLPKSDVKLGINWLFEPTINFYRSVWEIDWILPADRNGLNESDNYYYTFREELKPQILQDSKIIFKSKNIGTILLKNEKK